MVQEAYVSFEVAKLLIEKGFNEPTLAYAYGQDIISYYSIPKVTDPLSIEAGRIPLPTQQMAMRWLREVHNILIDIRFNRTFQRFKFFVFFMGADDDDMYDCINLSKRESYEEAVESALNYALNNLV